MTWNYFQIFLKSEPHLFNLYSGTISNINQLLAMEIIPKGEGWMR